MAATKCSKCGFVGARGNEVCKRCGASLHQSAPPPQSAGDMRHKVIPLGIASAIVVLIAGAWFAFSIFPTATPAPAEVASLLYADSTLSQPLTIKLPTELKQKIYQENAEEWFLMQSHVDVLVMQQLGFALVDSTKTKGDKPDCHRYRTQRFVDKGDFDRGPTWRDLHPVPWTEPDHIPDPDGPYEECKDFWTYETKIEFDDPETIDVAALSDKVKSLADIPDPLDVEQRPFSVRGGVSKSFAIGTMKIVEVSDVVLNKAGVYTVGFKFRMKPNGLGELFDFSGAIHKSLPQGIRAIFRNDILDKTRVEERVLYMVNAVGSDGLTRGHAELTKAGLFSRKWKIAKVYLDQVDDTPYTFHRVE